MGDTAGIRDWFARWGDCVANLDFDTARTMFLPSVVGFGTFKDIVHGLDALERGQWRSIWPTIEDFAFDLDSLEVLFSPDSRQAVAIVTWHSTGIDTDGNRFPRPGRATVVMERRSEGWQVIHTHFSVTPGTPPRTFGRSG